MQTTESESELESEYIIFFILNLKMLGQHSHLSPGKPSTLNSSHRPRPQPDSWKPNQATNGVDVGDGDGDADGNGNVDASGRHTAGTTWPDTCRQLGRACAASSTMKMTMVAVAWLGWVDLARVGG